MSKAGCIVKAESYLERGPARRNGGGAKVANKKSIPSSELKRVLKPVLRGALDLVGASAGALLLAEGEQKLTLSVGQGLKGYLAPWVAQHGEPSVLKSGQQTAPVPVLPLVEDEYLPSMAVPLVIGGEAAGALLVTFPSAPHVEDRHQQERFLQLAAQLAIALIEKHRLQKALQKKEEQLRLLAKASNEAREAEREWLSMEIHDRLAQTLTSAFRYLQALESLPAAQAIHFASMLTKASGQVKEALQQARGVIRTLHPGALSTLGLVATLRQEMRELQVHSGWQVEFIAEDLKLSQESEITLYRIIREAVTNCQRHAGTARLRVSLRRKGNQIVAEVRDWGKGFNPASLQEMPPRGIGLLSMRKYAELAGGRCTIKSRVGEGTTVRVQVPA